MPVSPTQQRLLSLYKSTQDWIGVITQNAYDGFHSADRVNERTLASVGRDVWSLLNHANRSLTRTRDILKSGKVSGAILHNRLAIKKMRQATIRAKHMQTGAQNALRDAESKEKRIILNNVLGYSERIYSSGREIESKLHRLMKLLIKAGRDEPQGPRPGPERREANLNLSKLVPVFEKQYREISRAATDWLSSSREVQRVQSPEARAIGSMLRDAIQRIEDGRGKTLDVKEHLRQGNILPAIRAASNISGPLQRAAVTISKAAYKWSKMELPGGITPANQQQTVSNLRQTAADLMRESRNAKNKANMLDRILRTVG